MNGYRLAATFLIFLFFIDYLEIQESIKSTFEGFSDIFQFRHRGQNPMVFDIGILLAILIFLTGLVKIFVTGKTDDD